MKFLLDVLYLSFGAYIIFLGFRAQETLLLHDRNKVGLSDPDVNLPDGKLFISQMVVGAFICLISGYKLYSLF